MNVTSEQLAQLLMGVARAQQAVVDAIESSRPGFKGSHLAPALDRAAKIRATSRPLTLQELPARVLIQCQSRVGPNLKQITAELEALLKA
jgi:hypothetical protein